METTFNEKTFVEKFEKLYNLDLTNVVTKKDTGKKTLQYLSWNDAVKEFTKVFPDFDYKIEFFEGKPYIYDEILGYMVMVSVTAGGKTKTMWLPVMDEHNCSMKKESYRVTYKNGSEIEVKAATMFDINKSIMRCLTKCLSMFGLGLKLYSVDEATVNGSKPTYNSQNKTSNTSSAQNSNGKASEKQITWITNMMKDNGMVTPEEQMKFLKDNAGVERFVDLTQQNASKLIEILKK